MEVGGLMARPQRTRRIPAIPVLLLVASLLGGVVLMPFGVPPEKVSGQIAPIPSPPPPPPGPAGVSYPVPPEFAQLDLSKQTPEMVAQKSFGCVQCHQEAHDPHFKPETVRLGCVDCHGGDPTTNDKLHAHVWPRLP